MNREGAETFLRLLAEAQLRDQALLRTPSPGAPFVSIPVALSRAAWALTVVGALDLETAETVLADAELALAARHRPEPPEAGVIGSAVQSGVAGLAASRRFASSRIAFGHRQQAPRAGASVAAEPGGGPDRYVPVGLMVLFHDQTVSGELDLMSYVHTTSGARLVAAWRARDLLGHPHGRLPVDAFTVTDDRGNRYHLLFTPRGAPEPTCDLALTPDPPPDIRWLEVTTPGEQAVRVDLDGQAVLPKPEINDRELSVGEHLLNRVADRMLTMVPEFPALVTPGPLASLGAGLGAAIAALEAAEVLSPLSPVPGQLAALCASLRVRGHGITAAPAPDLPEPWLSMLSHYHRRRPDTAPAEDGFAGMAVPLPEFDGIRLVLLGLHNCDGGTWVNALTFGQLIRHRPGPLGLDMAVPLSIWVRDDAGRWHVARPTGWMGGGGEAELTLRLTPPLTRSPDWIEVRAAGQSAEVRTTVPLVWGYRS